jgi:hypothetical protein
MGTKRQGDKEMERQGNLQRGDEKIVELQAISWVD